MQLTRSELKVAYRRMCLIREFEDAVHVEDAIGNIPGFVHLYAGEEASAVGVCMHLDDTDYISSTHRGHGHCIAKGCDPEGMMLEIFGKDGGVCNGKGGSMHIADMSKGMLGANGIVGGGPPLVCGAALSAKTRKTGGVAVAFVGDGGSNQGTTLESLNLAMVLNLPAIFVIEDNGYAEATASSWSVSGSQLERAKGFGMRALKVDGHDFFEVWNAMREAVEHARSGKGPMLLHVELNRYYGHYEGDATTYRAPGEVDKIKAEKDCLMLFKQRVTEAGLLDATELGDIEAETKASIESCVEVARAAEMPPADDVIQNVYANY